MTVDDMCAAAPATNSFSRRSIGGLYRMMVPSVASGRGEQPLSPTKGAMQLCKLLGDDRRTSAPPVKRRRRYNTKSSELRPHRQPGLLQDEMPRQPLQSLSVGAAARQTKAAPEVARCHLRARRVRQLFQQKLRQRDQYTECASDEAPAATLPLADLAGKASSGVKKRYFKKTREL
eukprot:TRINITY_DN4274_c0_g1_i1.p1 TRINITY_DN4274_c0_g1~~TRINITY_DN4274_c0_g1_i1.p1  ORF type:complete len:176 (-),score=32.13 TRINITY_DN4274_c0_g1_i1:329-856(-)